ncbi:MAG: hypothetical protein HXX81_03465 [Campylobacterales bacterium]|nr:hypothetical protein [Campylobacterales bacterium]
MEFENVGKEIKEPNMLFERFYREDNARGGFGLGLNIVSQICRKNGYQIEVTSENNCNIFRYKLPKGAS